MDVLSIVAISIARIAAPEEVDLDSVNPTMQRVAQSMTTHMTSRTA